MASNLDYAYDQYLKARETSAVSALLRFQETLKTPAFAYGRFTVPSFYKTYFVTPKQQHLLKRVAAAFSQILNKAARFYFEETQMHARFGLSPVAEELIRIDPGYSQHVVFSRFDAILEGESLKLLEFNSDIPAGAAYADQLEAAILSDEFFKPFAEENHLAASERVQGILTTLLSVYEEFGGYETPQIAIVAWRHARASAAFEYMKRHFESKGYKTLVADPRELQYKGGKLYHKGSRIHLAYRAIAFEEILDRMDEVQDLLRAYKDKAVCLVNPLRSRLASSKSIVSFLTTPECDRFFTENENEMKRQHLPWTRCLSDAEDFYGHRKVFLIDFLKDEKDTIVLKPSGSSHGSRRVYIGCETPDAEWNTAVDRALKEQDWVIQEQVPVPMMTVPESVNQKLDFAYKKHNFNLLVSGGKYAGGFARLSDESVVNVGTGGGLIPALWTDVAPDHFGA